MSYPRLRDLTRQQMDQQDFSLAAMINGMADKNIPGYERGILEATADRAGKEFDPQRVSLPWELMATSGLGRQQRDMNVATSTLGGYLVGTAVASPLDILRGFSVVANA